MKRNFYLQHPIMAMNDPRMKKLIDKERLKGSGAYWFIIEKLALLPEPRAQLEYLQPFCVGRKIPLSYLQKIIREYDLFIFDEDNYFTPAELNPAKKKDEVSKMFRELTFQCPKTTEKCRNRLGRKRKKRV